MQNVSVVCEDSFYKCDADADSEGVGGVAALHACLSEDASYGEEALFRAAVRVPKISSAQVGAPVASDQAPGAVLVVVQLRTAT